MLNKDVIRNIIIITIVFILIICISIIFSMIFSIFKYKNVQYYEFNKDKIPSINSIVGKRNLYYYSDDSDSVIESKTYKYTGVSNTRSDLSTYVKTLEEDYNYAYTSSINLTKEKGDFELSSNSYDDGKIIIIDIKYDKNSYEIKITKGIGNINFNK